MVAKMGIYEEVKGFLEEHQIVTDESFQELEQSPLVVAVSGGPDSLTLLHVLVQRGLYPQNKIIVAHVDHCLRPSSAEEAQYVAKIAEEWGVSCRVERIDVNDRAQALGMSLEAAGRQARYQFLAKVAGEIGASVTAVGHNADDQAETVLMHFLRGTGLAGLSGMLPACPMPEAEDYTLIRPLLSISRLEIESYCGENELHPIYDASNADVGFFRNRLRHELLPFLDEYNPGIRERLTNMASIIVADHELLNQITEETWSGVKIRSGKGWIHLDRNQWWGLPLALRRRMLIHGAGQLLGSTADIGFTNIEQARQLAETGQVGARINLPDQLMLIVGYDYLALQVGEEVDSDPYLPQLKDETVHVLPVPYTFELSSGWSIEAVELKQVNFDLIKSNPDPWLAFIGIEDLDDLIVRPRFSGEKFKPLGLGNKTREVRRVMIDHKIPQKLRSLWPIVANSQHLLWLVGHHQDERSRVTPESRHVVQLRATRLRV